MLELNFETETNLMVKSLIDKLLTKQYEASSIFVADSEKRFMRQTEYDLKYLLSNRVIAQYCELYEKGFSREALTNVYNVLDLVYKNLEALNQMMTKEYEEA